MAYIPLIDYTYTGNIAAGSTIPDGLTCSDSTAWYVESGVLKKNKAPNSANTFRKLADTHTATKVILTIAALPAYSSFSNPNAFFSGMAAAIAAIPRTGGHGGNGTDYVGGAAVASTAYKMVSVIDGSPTYGTSGALPTGQDLIITCYNDTTNGQHYDGSIATVADPTTVIATFTQVNNPYVDTVNGPGLDIYVDPADTHLVGIKRVQMFYDDGNAGPGPLVAGTLSADTITSNSATIHSTAPTGGTGPYTQQAYLSTTSGFTPGSGNLVAGATSLNDVLNGLTASGDYYAKMVYHDASTGVATSNEVHFTTLATSGALHCNEIFIDSVNSSTGAVTAHVSPVGGTLPYSYQWYQRGKVSNNSPSTAIAGATSASVIYTVPNVTNGFDYILCKVTDGASTVSWSTQIVGYEQGDAAAAAIAAATGVDYAIPTPRPILNQTSKRFFIPLLGDSRTQAGNVAPGVKAMLDGDNSRGDNVIINGGHAATAIADWLPTTAVGGAGSVGNSLIDSTKNNYNGLLDAIAAQMAAGEAIDLLFNLGFNDCNNAGLTTTITNNYKAFFDAYFADSRLSGHALRVFIEPVYFSNYNGDIEQNVNNLNTFFATLPGLYPSKIYMTLCHTSAYAANRQVGSNSVYASSGNVHLSSAGETADGKFRGESYLIKALELSNPAVVPTSGCPAATLGLVAGVPTLTRTQSARNAVGYKYYRVVGRTVTQFADTNALVVADSSYSGPIPDSYNIIPYDSSNNTLLGVRVHIPRRYN